MFETIGPQIPDLETLHTIRRWGDAAPVRLVDTTMLWAPRSGGVKRYLGAKRAWLAAERPRACAHTLVVPAPAPRPRQRRGEVSIYAAPLPFADGYRWPVSQHRLWMQRLLRQRPRSDRGRRSLYAGPGGAERRRMPLGVPVVGFCHTDLGALAAAASSANGPAQRAGAPALGARSTGASIGWSRPAVSSPSAWPNAGVADPPRLAAGRRPPELFASQARRATGACGGAWAWRIPTIGLLVFAGRPAREKRVEVLIEAVGSDWAIPIACSCSIGAAAPDRA